MNDLFREVIEYRTYCLIEQSVRYDSNVTHEFHPMAKRTAEQMKDKMFSEKYFISVFAFSQEIKSVCETCGTTEEAAMCLSKRFLTGPS